METKFNYLKSVPLLAGLPEETLQDLTRTASEKSLADGAVLVWENTVGDALFIITAGVVDIVKGHQTPTPQVIATRGPGEVVGEMSLVENQSRSATVVARGTVQIISIPFSSFKRAVWGNVSATQQMVLALSQKLRQAQEKQYQDLLRHHEEFARLEEAFLSTLATGLTSPMLEVKTTTLETVRQDLHGELDKLEQLKLHVKTLLNYITLVQQQQAGELKTPPMKTGDFIKTKQMANVSGAIYPGARPQA